jgi:hypothetical protein
VVEPKEKIDVPEENINQKAETVSEMSGVDKKSEKADVKNVQELFAKEIAVTTNEEAESCDVQMEEKIETPTAAVGETRMISNQSSLVDDESDKMIDNKPEEENIGKSEIEKLSDLSTDNRDKEGDSVEDMKVEENLSDKVDNLSSFKAPENADKDVIEKAVDNKPGKLLTQLTHFLQLCL